VPWKQPLLTPWYALPCFAASECCCMLFDAYHLSYTPLYLVHNSFDMRSVPNLE